MKEEARIKRMRGKRGHEWKGQCNSIENTLDAALSAGEEGEV